MATAASRVVVIGAGSAGISAARTLQEQGESAIVLEARGRAGGRAWSETGTFGFPVDMGCAWLHSADLNPWTRYAREQGFTLIERSPVWQRRIGRNETTAEQRDEWLAAFHRNETLIAEAVRAGRDVAVADVVPQDRFRPLFDGVMTWLMGTDSDKVSTLDYDRYQDSDRNWAVVEGLGSVIAHGARGLDIRLDTPAQKIDWHGPRVRVTTPRGDLEADAVIVTVPTTVLAEETALRFSPALPQTYRDAFQGVPLGIANKVFFQMEPGTLPFEESVNMVGTDQTVRTAAYQTRPSGHEVMLAYFGGSLARELEQHQQLEVFARDQLAGIFGSDFVRHIRRTLQTGWATDPWSRGAYSAALPGKAHMREWLSEPVGDRIFFAGEACSIEYFGTVHGARLTGTAVARRVLDTL